MRDIEYIRKISPRYGLVAEYLNEDTLKVYSEKYFFDSWLVVENRKEKCMELWHKSKKKNLKKCSYHLQSVVPRKYKKRVLEKINSHNRYVAFYKNKKKINLVDRVLSGL